MSQRGSHSNPRPSPEQVLTELRRQRTELDLVSDAMAMMMAERTCLRCRTPQPPSPRWPGDRWAVCNPPPRSSGRGWL